MKKILYFILIVPLFINGCFLDEKDITRMIFPVTMLISNEDDKFQIYLLSLSDSANSKIELETSTEISKYSLSKFEDTSLDGAISKSGIATNGTTSAIKIETIILHKSVFENNENNYDKITSRILNNPLFRTSTYVYYTHYDPKELLNINSLDVSNNYYYYIIRPEKENLEDYILPSRVVDGTKAYIDNKRMFYLPSLIIKPDSVLKEHEGKLEPVNIYSIDGAYFLNRKGTFTFVELEKLNGFKWMDKKEYFDINLNETAPLYLKIETVNWNTFINDNIPSLDIKIKVKINYNHTNLSIKEIETRLKKLIKKDVYETYTSLYKDIDIYLFNDLAYRLKKDIGIPYSFNLNIDLTIKNTIYEY